MHSQQFRSKRRVAKRGQRMPQANRIAAGRGRRLVIEQLEPRRLLAATWTKLNNSPPAGNGTMELLTNGSVLMTNGGDEWSILTPSASGSYAAGTWIRTSNADYTRLYDATDVLQNGDVFVAGGEYGTGSDTGEVYNPTTNVWIQLPVAALRRVCRFIIHARHRRHVEWQCHGHAGIPFAERLHDGLLPIDQYLGSRPQAVSRRRCRRTEHGQAGRRLHTYGRRQRHFGTVYPIAQPMGQRRNGACRSL